MKYNIQVIFLVYLQIDLKLVIFMLLIINSTYILIGYHDLNIILYMKHFHKVNNIGHANLSIGIFHRCCFVKKSHSTLP